MTLELICRNIERGHQDKLYFGGTRAEFDPYNPNRGNATACRASATMEIVLSELTFEKGSANATGSWSSSAISNQSTWEAEKMCDDEARNMWKNDCHRFFQHAQNSGFQFSGGEYTEHPTIQIGGLGKTVRFLRIIIESGQGSGALLTACEKLRKWLINEHIERIISGEDAEIFNEEMTHEKEIKKGKLKEKSNQRKLSRELRSMDAKTAVINGIFSRWDNGEPLTETSMTSVIGWLHDPVFWDCVRIDNYASAIKHLTVYVKSGKKEFIPYLKQFKSENPKKPCCSCNCTIL